MKTQEKIYIWEQKTFSDVAERIPFFIEDEYNKKRFYSSLDYRFPDEYERLSSEDNSREYI